MTTVENVIKGWVVRGKLNATQDKSEQISRRYHVEQAARDFAKLAEQQGVRDVEVRAVHGIERKL